ncbi:mechanosensitive ion channel [Phycisphaeraceae bacterium D3-23]
MGLGFTLAQAEGPTGGSADTPTEGSAGDAAGAGTAPGEDVAPLNGGSVKDDTATAWEGLREGDFSAAMPLIEKYLVPAVVAILVLIVAYFVGKFLARTLSSPIKKRVDEALGLFVGKMIFWAIMVFALLGVLGRYGISVAGFAAVLAAAGFAIGMAFQGTLGNFAAGIMLLVFRPFKVGDTVNAAGITAKVIEIDLFNTVFDTPDNRRIIVPNSAIAGNTIENVTFHPVRRCDVVVGADYGASIDATRAALEKAAQSLGDMLVEGEGRGYKIVLGELGDSSVAWTVRFWCKTADFWDVKEALTRAVKMHLDEAGIGIPYPQMDVHLVKDAS